MPPDSVRQLPPPAPAVCRDPSPALNACWPAASETAASPPNAMAADPLFGHTLSDYSIFPPSGGMGDGPGSPLGDWAGPLPVSAPLAQPPVTQAAASAGPATPPTPTHAAGPIPYHQVSQDQLRKIMWASTGLPNAPTAPAAPTMPADGMGAAHDQMMQKYQADQKAYEKKEQTYEKNKAAYDKKYGKRVDAFDKSMTENIGPMNDAMKEFGINSAHEQAAFLGNIALESGGMTKLTEEASGYASSKSEYKGRGFIQLTGHDNYAKASKALHIADPKAPKAKAGATAGKKAADPYDGLLKNPELALDPANDSRIAAWYWTQEAHIHDDFGDQPAADMSDVRRSASRVNMGPGNSISRPLGLGSRMAGYDRALSALDVPKSPEWQQQINDTVKQERAIDKTQDGVQKPLNQAKTALSAFQSQQKQEEKAGKKYTPDEEKQRQQHLAALEKTRNAAQVSWDKAMLPDQTAFTQNEKARVAAEQADPSLSPERKSYLTRQAKEITHSEGFIQTENTRVSDYDKANRPPGS